ncbi:MAG: hypothetical protein ABL994_16245, partial [Verrucomicrobiales bacterium]
MPLKSNKPVVISIAFLLALSADSRCQETITADLDLFITLPDAYRITPDDLEKRFEQGDWTKNPYFKWLNGDKSRAIFQRKDLDNLKVDLTLLKGTVPIEEAIIDFKNGTLIGVTISIFNRGDGGSIAADDFEKRFKSMGRHIGEQLQASPTRREAKPTQGQLTSGFLWISARGKAVLEHNPEAPGNTEFLRMRLARRDAGGAYEAAMQSRPGASVKLSDLPAKVKRDESGNVFITDIPMVDQGAKGYCVVASAQRLFEYYGIHCDMHQLAQIAGSDPEKGTSSLEINEQLGAIDHLFKTRFTCLAVAQPSGLVELIDGQYVGPPVPEADFHTIIEKSIDAGIPLLWSLEVGLFPEEPPLQEQAGGGHMRMITGYNTKSGRLIFSDSWGAGHEFKTMNAEDAYRATRGLFLMKPIVR